MYVGARTLTALQIFLHGVSFGQVWAGRLRDGEPPFSEFSEWFKVHLSLTCAGSGGWYSAIKDLCPDDKEAFDRFFDYLELYRQRKSEFQRYFTLTSSQRKMYSATHREPSPDLLRLTRYQGERCQFLHARKKPHQGWYLHTTFRSAVGMRPWFERVFGITSTQWNRVMKKS